MLTVFWRVLILYPLVIFGIRLMGKRQIGEMQPNELVITILISNIATLPLEDQNLPLLMSVSPMLLLICFEVLLSTNGNVSVYQKAEARPVNCGDLKIPVQPADPPEVLIADGCISKEGLTASPFTEKKLLQILRQKKLRPEDVFLLTADASGICTLIPKEDAS